MRVKIANNSSRLVGQRIHRVSICFGVLHRHIGESSQNLALLVTDNISFHSRLHLDAFDGFLDFTLCELIIKEKSVMHWTNAKSPTLTIPLVYFAKSPIFLQ